MHIVHLTASTHFGGPERQMLGLAEALPADVRISFVLFRELGYGQAFLDRLHTAGIRADALLRDTPSLGATTRELTDRVRALGADVLLCHGYKANLLGRVAARRCRIPAVAVSRGWTGENLKVKLYEWIDRRHLRWMDRVVCVSGAQAEKVLAAGVPGNRVRVIRNSARLLDPLPRPECRDRLQQFFATPGEIVVAAAGRLSPEKGFDLYVEAAARLCRTQPNTRFIHFGDGPLRLQLQRRIDALGLSGSIVLAGFRDDVDDLLPACQLAVLPSYTEGLPNVALEAASAALPIVATAVGGTPEVVIHGATGTLVQPGDVDALAAAMNQLLNEPLRRKAYGLAGRRRMLDEFTFAAQARAYQRLFAEFQPAARLRVAA